MGIYFDAVLYYGIEYSYEEVLHLARHEEISDLMDHDEIVKFEETKKCPSFPYLFGELGFDSAIGDLSEDEKNHSYIVGISLDQDVTFDEFLKKINKAEAETFIQESCQKYNLPYREPKILCRANRS